MNRVSPLYVVAHEFVGYQAVRSVDHTRTVYNAMQISMSASTFIPGGGWMITYKGFLPCMGSHMNVKMGLLEEDFGAGWNAALILFPGPWMSLWHSDVAVGTWLWACDSITNLIRAAGV